MASLTEQIKQLREQTGAGMVDCKNALTESGGVMDAAVEILRKKGAAMALKKAGRIAAEGLIGFALSKEGTRAALVEVNCETDFVAKNDQFLSLCDELTRQVVESQITTIDEIPSLRLSDGTSVETKVQDLIAKIGEKVSVRRFIRLAKTAPTDALVAYMHPGNKIGVLVYAEGGANSAEEHAFLKDVAMHIAAMSPQYLAAADVPEDRLLKEKEIFAAQMAEEKKPAEIIAKILDGKLNKFKKEVSLLDQVFVKDPEGKQSVAQWMKSHFPSLSLGQFVRYQVGEGIEKKIDNFVDEVARQVAQSNK